MASFWRSAVIVPAVIGAGAILGGIYGPGVVGVAAASTSTEDDISASIKTFTSVYDLVERN